MPMTNESNRCKKCKQFFLPHELIGNTAYKRGMCFQCLLNLCNKLQSLLNKIRREKKPNHRKK